MATELIVSLLVVAGSLLMLLAAIGMVRMPDIYMRISTASKASTLGVAALLLALAIHFGELGLTMRALGILAFIVATTPVAAHVIGRAAYLVGIHLWEGTVVDELRGRYDRHAGQLQSADGTDETNRPGER